MEGIKILLIYFTVVFTVVLSSNIRRYPANVRVEQDRDDTDIKKVYIQGINEVQELRLKPVRENIWAKSASFITLGKEHNSFEDKVSTMDYPVYYDPESGAVLGIDGQRVSGILDHSLTIKNEGDNHYLYKFDIQRELRNDVIIPPNSSLTYSYENVKTGGTYTIEVLVVTDSVLTGLFKTKSELLNYIKVIFNSVNLKFETIKTSKFNVKLVGTVISTSTSDEPFIQEDPITSSTLYKFRDWAYVMNEQNKLPTYDAAYLMLGRKISGALGWAFQPGACNAATNVGMGEDNGYYTYDNVIAHELAHNMDSSHDGNKRDGKICQPASHIMGSGITRFSSCSAAQMEAYAQSEQGSCLRRIDNNDVDSNIPDTNNLPGEVMNNDELCKKKMNSDDAFCIDGCDTCGGIVCEDEESYDYAFIPEPPEGSACLIKETGKMGQCKHYICS